MTSLRSKNLPEASGDTPQKAGVWITNGAQVLLVRRASHLTEPETWSVPAGHVKVGENLLDGAYREVREEVGFLPPHVVDGSWEVLGCTIFRAKTADVGWTPLLNEESTDFVWADARWLRENWGALHPGLQALLPNTRTAKRDTIDKKWVDKVRKTWKGYAGKKRSVGYMEASAYLQKGIEWLEALANDMAFSKGFFTFLRKPGDGGDETIYKMKFKAMDDLHDALAELRRGKSNVEFWDRVMTPGTRDWNLGGDHRYQAMLDLAKADGRPEAVSTMEDANQFAQSNPHLVEKFLARQIRGTTVEAVTNADAVFSRKFLAHLTRIMNKWNSNIEWGSYEREFSVGKVKVVMVDLYPFPHERGSHRIPAAAVGYVKQLQKAEALLRQKGLGFLWYGTFFVSCKDCGGENALGAKFGVGARYHIGPDHVTIFSDPHNNLHRLVAHELGHRYYYKFMSSADRARFNAEFGDIPAVSEYGATVAEEDFAEVFSYYIDNRNLTRGQLERFKRFLTTRGKRAHTCSEVKYLSGTVKL